MAYATSNPPKLIHSAAGDHDGPGAAPANSNLRTPNIWLYGDGDLIATVLASGYFTNGYFLGMRVSDIVMFTESTSGLTYRLYVSVSATTGATTVTNPEAVAAVVAAGSSASDAGDLVNQYNAVSGADNTTGVVLPAASTSSRVVHVTNIVVNKVLPVYPVDGGNDQINELAEDKPFLLGPGQSATFIPISATQWYVSVDSNVVPHSDRALTQELFDDFNVATIDTTDKWLTFDGGGANAAAAAIVASPEGKVDLITGTAGTAGVADAACMSARVITHGQAVSLGMTVLEARVSTSHITGATLCVGLSDKIVDDSAEAVLHVIKTAAISDDGLTVTDAASFTQDSEATGATLWHAVTENTGTIAHVAAAGDCALDVGPTANTYQVLRIEIDPSGDARFYVDGVLKFTETTAVATTAVLVPYIAGTAEDATPVSTTLSVDYIRFTQYRNPSNS